MRIGDIDLIPLDDGLVKMTQAFYVGLDFEAHPELVAEDGKVHIPIGCFVVRSGDRTVLVDAGLGPIDVGWARGGDLPGQLAAAGIDPSEIDTVLCTHLHLDHIGWLFHDGAPFFTNATVRYGEGDWEQLVSGAPEGDPGRTLMEAMAGTGRLEPMSGDLVSIAPGLTARATPGHTLGHYGLIVSSGDERAVLLGDAVECPLQLEEPDFYVLSDVDPALAARTREALWQELEGTSTTIVGAHFPGLEFGRVMRGEGKRYLSI